MARLDVIGWQHGTTPAPPDGLSVEAVKAWRAWFGSWQAAHWLPHDVPGLRVLVRLFDEVERGEFVRSTELRRWQDAYGLTPRGATLRRWAPPQGGAEGSVRNDDDHQGNPGISVCVWRESPRHGTRLETDVRAADPAPPQGGDGGVGVGRSVPTDMLFTPPSCIPHAWGVGLNATPSPRIEADLAGSGGVTAPAPDGPTPPPLGGAS